jgi:hypothetical protein
MDGFPPALLTGGGIAGILTFLILAFARGWLLTAGQLQLLLSIKDQQIADKDSQVVMWRAVGETSQAQTVELLEHARLSTQLLTAIEARAKAAEDRKSP